MDLCVCQVLVFFIFYSVSVLVGTTEAERIMVDILLNHYMDLRVSIDNVTYSPDYVSTYVNHKSVTLK